MKDNKKWIIIFSSVLLVVVSIIICIFIKKQDNVNYPPQTEDLAEPNSSNISSSTSIDKTEIEIPGTVTSSETLSAVDDSSVLHSSTKAPTLSTTKKKPYSGTTAKTTKSVTSSTSEPSTIQNVVNIPDSEIQNILDRISQANTAMKEYTGEDVFNNPSGSFSAKGAVCYIAEYGKKDILRNKISYKNQVPYQIALPPQVCLGTAILLIDETFDANDITEKAPSSDRVYIGDDGQIYYRYLDDNVERNFTYVSATQSGPTLKITAKGQGNYAGSNYIITVENTYSDFWRVSDFKKA